MEEVRKGEQTPSRSFVLPYEQTKGREAVELYNKTDRTAQPWQELLLFDMMAVQQDGLWTHTKFGYSLPRRNGKNEVITIRELYGIMHGERILHTAHRTTTTHSAWERLVDRVNHLGLIEGENYKTRKQFGLETIEIFEQGVIEFRTRTSKGGLGEGFDLLVIDEAQEYQDDQESALKYVVTDSPNPQTVFLGTPPTPVSSGTVFMKFRNKCLSGEAENSAWEEWSVEEMSDPTDRENWYRTNPSLGTIFTERSVTDEIGSDATDFNIQRLGLWIQYNLHSSISKSEWDACKLDTLPKFKGALFAGVKFSKEDSVSVSIALRTTDGKIFVECVDRRSTRDGDIWLCQFLEKARPKKIIIDGASGQTRLSDALKQAKVHGIVLPTVRDIINANALLEPMIEQKTICHMEQPSVEQAITNTEHRAIGTNGGYGYKSLRNGIDISIVDSIVLANWAVTEWGKEVKRQTVSY